MSRLNLPHGIFNHNTCHSIRSELVDQQQNRRGSKVNFSWLVSTSYSALTLLAHLGRVTLVASSL